MRKIRRRRMCGFSLWKPHSERGAKKHFKKILSDSVDEYKKIKDEEVKRRIAEGEQFYTFDIPTDEYFNENVSEKVERMPHYVMKPCYLDKDRSDPNGLPFLKPAIGISRFLHEPEKGIRSMDA